jgi:GntR family transcriptional regulator
VPIQGKPAFSLVSYLDRVTIDLDQPVPPYRQLAAILRGKIASGDLSGRLPSEKTLMQEYHLAHGTVRKALALLRDEGLVQTTPGWGTYVVTTP